MARLEDIPEPSRTAVSTVACTRYDTQPFVTGPKLSERRMAIVSSAALIARGEAPFHFGETGFRTVPADRPAGDILMSHVSINFDRSGFQRDINVAYPVDRMRELADEGVIGGLGSTNYTIMGASDPDGMGDTVDQIAGQLAQERIDSVLLVPV